MDGYYCSLEDVKDALDFKTTARSDKQMMRLIGAASAQIEKQMNRSFMPVVGTRYFDWPNLQYAWPFTLHLQRNEVISVTTLVGGGVTIPSTDYYLEPNEYGPPYERIDLRLDKNSFWGGGATWQRNIAVTGVFGYGNDTAPAGTLVTAGINASVTTLQVSTPSLVGTGDTIIIDSEYMTVTGRSNVSTGQTLQTPMTANVGFVAVAVTDGTKFSEDDVILLDGERMLVIDVSGNSLTVKRQWDGSALQAHTGSTIYLRSQLTVVRGACGTTAASHLQNATIKTHQVPQLIRSLCVAEAVNLYNQETGGYAAQSGSAEGRYEASGNRSNPRALNDLRDQAYDRYARKFRVRAV